VKPGALTHSQERKNQEEASQWARIALLSRAVMLSDQLRKRYMLLEELGNEPCHICLSSPLTLNG
jgi:hypothetical protein